MAIVYTLAIISLKFIIRGMFASSEPRIDFDEGYFSDEGESKATCVDGQRPTEFGKIQ